MTLTGSDGQTKANVTGYSRDKGDNSKLEMHLTIEVLKLEIH